MYQIKRLRLSVVVYIKNKEHQTNLTYSRQLFKNPLKGKTSTSTSEIEIFCTDSAASTSKPVEAH